MNRNVIVTGASGGLGGTVARRFGADGDRVLVHYFQSQKDAEKVAGDINAGPGEARLFQADVCEYTQVKKMMDDVIAKWERIDVLVNCAGGSVRIMGRFRAIPDMDDVAWDGVVDTNLRGTYYCIKAVFPYMVQQRDGHIINVASGLGLAGAKGRVSYSAAKAGVIGLNKTVAIELGEYNVKVNAVCPGLILHDRTRAEYPPDVYERIKNLNLLRRTGTPEEFASFVFHLSTMNNISGQTINLDSRILF